MWRPPKNDDERLQNLIEALAEPDEDGDDAIDQQMHRDLARRGLTLESWAAQLEALGNEVIEEDRRARRRRKVKIAAAAAAGLCAAAAGGVLALQTIGGPRGGPKGGMDVQQSFSSQPTAIEPDAGRGAPPRR